MGNEMFIFWFWDPQQQVDMNARSKNTFIVLLYAFNFFYLICSTIHFSKPLVCVTLICGDWSQFHFISPDKTAFVMWAKNSKMNLHLHSDQREKTNKWADNMLMFHVEVNMKGHGIRFKKDSLQWFRVDSFFWETITLYTVHFQI